MTEKQRESGEPAIRLSGVRKVFSHRLSGESSIKEMALDALALRRSKKLETVALDGIDLEVKRGEAIGVVGRNGSGKTTMLKLIAGVTPPTDGEVKTNGRIGVITDLQSGFHGDLSGMENIFLQAALQGIQRQDVFPLLDDIQYFAGLDEFIYTPVKNYSSGMFVRLAFALAVHFSPDILLLDELLSCGDRYFQAKSLRRAKELKAKGVTIFLVSHFPEQIEPIADRVIWLDKGRVVSDGPTRKVLSQYQGDDINVFSQKPGDSYSLIGSSLANSQRFGSGEAFIEQARLINAEGQETDHFDEGEPIGVELEINTRQRCPVIDFVCSFYRDDGVYVGYSQSSALGFMLRDHEGQARIRMEAEPILADGLYLLTCALLPGEADYHSFYDICIRFTKFWVKSRQPRKVPSLCQFPMKVTWGP